jgi:O-antigen/teichoic acid export membrane protein
MDVLNHAPSQAATRPIAKSPAMDQLIDTPAANPARNANGQGDLRPSRTNNYLQGVTSGLLAKLLPVAIGFWLTPFILSRVGREGFGLYALATSVVAWLALLDIGLTPGLKAHLARKSAGADADMVSRLASSTFFPQLAIALLVFTAGVAGANLVPKALGVSEALADEAALLVVLLAAAMAVSMATQSFNAVLVAQQHLRRENVSRMALVVVRAAVLAGLLWRGSSLAALGAAHLAAVVLSAAMNVFWAYRLTPGLRVRPSLAALAELKPIAGCGGWFSAGAAAGLLINGSDRIVAGRMVSLEAVTVLTVTAAGYVLAEAALSQVINNARPALGQLLGENRGTTVLRTYRQLVLAGTGLGLIAASSIFASNHVFVEAWVGRAHYGGPLLDALLGLNCVLALAILPSRAVLAANLVVRPQTVARLVEGGLNLALAIGLTARFGLAGTIGSTALAALATSFWYLPRLTLKVLESDWRAMRDVPQRIALFAAAVAAAAWMGRTVAGSVAGLPGAICGALFPAAFGAALFWMMLLDSRVKRRLALWARSLPAGASLIAAGARVANPPPAASGANAAE